MTDSRFRPIRRQRAVENYLRIPENLISAYPKLLHLRLVHDRLKHRQQDFDDRLAGTSLRPFPLAPATKNLPK